MAFTGRSTMRFLARGLLLPLLWTAPVAAQSADSDHRIPDGPAFGATAGLFRVDNADNLFLVSLHHTTLRANGLSPNISVGLFPMAFAAYSLAGVADAGLAYNISLPYVTILPHAGLSTVFVAGPYYNTAVLGYETGISVLFNFVRTDAIRLEITRHQFFRDGISSSITIGIGGSGVQSRKPRLP
jgi:hypothetical protein